MLVDFLNLNIDRLLDIDNFGLVVGEALVFGFVVHHAAQGFFESGGLFDRLGHLQVHVEATLPFLR